MCGIFLSLLKRPLNDNDLFKCRQALKKLAHRGPNGQGEWYDMAKGVYFGHRRLAIQDLSEAAAQPMVENRFVLTYNGEIYNFKDLREQLQTLGESFSSTGDTQVLLKSWKKWGEDTLNRIEGMFAFAVWDGEKATICVDPFSEKPLYWYESPEGLYFSSELGPIKDLFDIHVKIENNDLLSFLSLGYIPPPNTVFALCYRMPAATRMVVKNGKIIQTTKYWNIPAFRIKKFSKSIEPTRAQIEFCRDALAESLSGRAISDAPLCVFLSSGVDSTLVATLLKYELSIDAECITTTFRGTDAVDEGKRASNIAKYLGLKHEVITTNLSEDDFNYYKALDLAGQPNEIMSIVPYYEMSKRVADKGYRVALTGNGADEVFLGYAKHHYFYRYRYIYNSPSGIRNIISKLLHLIKSSSAEGYDRLFNVPDTELCIAWKNAPAIKWLQGFDGFRRWARDRFTGYTRPHEIGVPNFEVFLNMPDGHLNIFDHGFMRASVEMRTPYLNRNLIEKLVTLDPRLFFATEQKRVLRKILALYLPKELFSHSKIGFAVPVQDIIGKYNWQTQIPFLENGQKQALIEHLFDGPGWKKIAMRVILLNEFISQHKESLI